MTIKLVTMFRISKKNGPIDLGLAPASARTTKTRSGLGGLGQRNNHVFNDRKTRKLLMSFNVAFFENVSGATRNHHISFNCFLPHFLMCLCKKLKHHGTN